MENRRGTVIPNIRGTVIPYDDVVVSDLYKFIYKPIEIEFNSTPYVESVTPVLTGLQRIERNPKLIHLSTLLEESRLTMDKCEFLGGRINYMYYRMLCQEVMREILYIIENEIKILSFFPRFEPSDYEKMVFLLPDFKVPLSKLIDSGVVTSKREDLYKPNFTERIIKKKGHK